MPVRYAANSTIRRRWIELGLLWVSMASFYACTQPPPPRTFIDFLDDPIAREGVLLRCNRDRDATARDPECADARRAAAAVAARQDEARRQELERQSEQKREALRAAIAAEQQRELDAQRAAEAAAQAAYEAQWVDTETNGATNGAAAPEPAAAAASADAAAVLAAPGDADLAGEPEAPALHFIVPPPVAAEAPPSPVAQQGEVPRPFREAAPGQ